MLNDTTSMNPQGRVKLELYNDTGVFFEKEKKNLVVTSANEIIANMISDPAKKSRYVQKDSGSTETLVNGNSLYVFDLSIQPESVKTTTLDVSSTNQEKLFFVQDMENATDILGVKKGDTDLVLDEDVFLKDASTGSIEFAEAPTEQIEIKFQSVENKQIEIIKGTESVRVAGEEWSRSKTPSTSIKTYAIDYDTGELYFESSTSQIEVTYDCAKHYGLGFMGIAGKPAGHPDHQPVSFSQGDKGLTSLDAEFEDARMPIIYPAPIETGKPELEVLPTKQAAYDEQVATVVAADDNGDETIDTMYQIDTSGKKLLDIVSAKKLSDTGDDEDLAVGTDVLINDAQTATIEFTTDLTEGDRFEVVYRLRKDDLHLRYSLTTAPVVGLINVFYEEASGVSAPVALDIENNGMQIGSGDVWMMNANQGIMQLSSAVEEMVSNPGQLTVEYQVNSGTVVKFVADFPQGVPGPLKAERTDSFVSAGETTFILGEVVSKDENEQFEVTSVLRNGAEETYTVHADGSRIDIDNVISGDSIIVEYNYFKDAHEIYQVAMFDEKETSASKMFNISGIGPVTKDKNTGMRITWSVTF